MPPKQRQIRIEQRGGLAAMQQLETRSDDELVRETRHRAAAQAILGARAADRYDPKAARAHFQKAIAAARPQERMQLRRMAQASIALAERRPGELKEAVEKLGHEAPSGRQLLALRFMGLIAPPPGSSVAIRARGFLLLFVIVALLLAAGVGLVELISLPFGGLPLTGALLLGALVVAVALGVLTLLGRRRQARARAQRAGP
ncbi:MAG TPA: hypothetical protein VKA96_07835 [Solirubrobacteraceae bacterium]|nr:hypothetical protein [Solirubrobacteraceae bacterium]